MYPIPVPGIRRRRGAFEDYLGISGPRAPRLVTASGTEDVLKSVSETAGAVGYVSLQSAEHPGVRILSIDGVQPRPLSIIEGDYRLARPFILLYKGESLDPGIRRFLTWVVSAEAQILVSRDRIPVR